MVPENVQPLVPLVLLVIPVLVLVITAKRFNNLGMSGWWWLGMLVPLLGLWLGYRLFAAPPGYAYTNKLDGVGKFLAVIYWLSLIACIALPIVAGFGLIQGLDPDQLDAWIAEIEAKAAELEENMGQQAE